MAYSYSSVDAIWISITKIGICIFEKMNKFSIVSRRADDFIDIELSDVEGEILSIKREIEVIWRMIVNKYFPLIVRGCP